MTTAVAPPNLTTSSSVFASGDGHETVLLDSLIPFFEPNLPVSTAIPEVPVTSTAQVKPNTPPLRFVNITTNPDVERKSHENRRLVRSAAMKHAVRLMKGDRQKPSTTKWKRKDAQEDENEPRSDQTGKRATTSGSLMPNAKDQIRQNQADRFNPYSLDPLSTFPVQALPQEVDLAGFRESTFLVESFPRFFRFGMTLKNTSIILLFANMRIFSEIRKMKGPFCIFFSWFNMPGSDNLMMPLLMGTPVLYHAMLYMATVNFVGINQKRLMGLRNALVHEQKVIGMVQREVNRPIPPSEEIIFGTAILAISQVSCPLYLLSSGGHPVLIAFSSSMTTQTPERLILR